MEEKNKGERWQKGETLITVIGQGFMLATPLQITNMTATLASGKKLSPKFYIVQIIFLKILRFL